MCTATTDKSSKKNVSIWDTATMAKVITLMLVFGMEPLIDLHATLKNSVGAPFNNPSDCPKVLSIRTHDSAHLFYHQCLITDFAKKINFNQNCFSWESKLGTTSTPKLGTLNTSERLRCWGKIFFNNSTELNKDAKKKTARHLRTSDTRKKEIRERLRTRDSKLESREKGM